MDALTWFASFPCNSKHLDCNDHHANYQTAAECIERNFNHDFEQVAPEVIKAMIEADTIWRCQIYPDTPIGSYLFHGATMQECLSAAMEQLKENHD